MKLKIAKTNLQNLLENLKRVRVAVVPFTLTKVDYTPCTQPNLGLLHAAKTMKKKFLKRPIFLYHI